MAVAANIWSGEVLAASSFASAGDNLPLVPAARVIAASKSALQVSVKVRTEGAKGIRDMR
jgi:hypothetical protein